MDIDHLKATSDLQTLTLVIDSKVRDPVAYPTPSSYVIPFDVPIKNVVGFDILDASIPVTEYTMDARNNELAMGYIFPSVCCTTALVVQTVHDHLYRSTDFMDIFQNKSDTHMFIFDDRAAFDTVYAGLDRPASGSHNLLILFESIAIRRSATAFPVVLDTATVYCVDAAARTAMLTNAAIATSYHVGADDVTFFNVGYATDAEALAMAGTVRDTDCPFSALISNVFRRFPARNFNSSKLYTYINTTLDLFTNDVISAVTENNFVAVRWEDPIDVGEISITQRYIWTMTRLDTFAFFLDMNKSTMRDLLGFSEIHDTNTKLFPSMTNRIFLSSMNEDDVFTQEIVTPGIIALERVQYIELHCPEIESHLLGTYAHFSYSPGIGLFKLLDSNTVTHLRFDFLNIERTPFHPIGKLTRLTLAFQHRDGTYYDFKGVDHTVLVAIKYYAPRAVARPPTSKLNPMYNPDVLKHKTRERAVAAPRSTKKMADVLHQHALASKNASE